MIAAQVACRKEIPKPRKKAPYESAKSETFAPAHGQKRLLALPDRSDSAITLGPFNSKSNIGTDRVYFVRRLSKRNQMPMTANPKPN